MSKPKIEFIVSYTVNDPDFEYSDNHGILIRCKDCKRRYTTSCPFGILKIGTPEDHDYCSKEVKK